MQFHSEDTVETCLTHFGNYFNWEESFEEVNALLESILSMDVGKWQYKVEPFPPSPSSSPSLPSIIEPPKLDLKPLRDTLKYVFLGSVETLLVIIASDLERNRRVSC